MVKTKDLYGILLAGGQSRRMNRDKALLQYHGRSQVLHGFDLLSENCEKVFVSCREDQSWEGIDKNHYLYDELQYKDFGPIGGILSAMNKFPDKSWLVLAIDLPFVNYDCLDYLIKNRSYSHDATAYKSSSDGLPEPLCAIWEAKALDSIKEFVRNKKCPRKYLINHNTKLLDLPDKKFLDNINSPEDLQKVINEF